MLGQQLRVSLTLWCDANKPLAAAMLPAHCPGSIVQLTLLCFLCKMPLSLSARREKWHSRLRQEVLSLVLPQMHNTTARRETTSEMSCFRA